jgi:hypothetical protein
MTLKRSLSDSTLCFSKEALRFKLHRLMANNRMNGVTNQSRQKNNISTKLQAQVLPKQFSTIHSNQIAPERRKVNNSMIDVSNIVRNKEFNNLLESPPSSPSSLASSTAPAVKTENANKQLEKKWCRKSTSLPHRQNNAETILRVHLLEHGIKKCKVILKRINVHEFKNPSNETKASNENKIKHRSRGRPKIGKSTKTTCKI